MNKIILPFLLTASLTFANNPNANLSNVMANAATGQMIKMVPLFIIHHLTPKTNDEHDYGNIFR